MNARSRLNEIFQQLTPAGQQLLQACVDFTADGELHVCTLTLPQLPGDHDGQQTFTGRARKRKHAQEHAAAAAVQHIERHHAGIQQHAPTTNTDNSIGDVLQQTLSEQGVARDVHLRSYISTAPSQAGYSTISVPLSILIGCKIFSKWLKARHGNSANDPAAQCALLRNALLQWQQAQGSATGVNIMEDGWAVSLPVQQPHQPQNAHLGQPTICKAVLLPQHASEQPTEVTIPVHYGQLPLQHLANLLSTHQEGPSQGPTQGSSGSRVLLHGKFAKRGVMPVDVPLQCFKPLLQASAESAPGDVVPLERPFLYSYAGMAFVDDASSGHRTGKPGKQQDQTLNARASWLAGYLLHGPAILAYIALDSSTSTVHVGQYGLTDLYRHVGTLLPEGEYVAGFSQDALAASLCRLPTIYSGPQVWFGHSPSHLLRMYVTAHLGAKDGQFVQVCTSDAKDKLVGVENAHTPSPETAPAEGPPSAAEGPQDMFTAQAMTPAWPGDVADSAEAVNRDESVAVEQAALTLLHALQQRVMALFGCNMPLPVHGGAIVDTADAAILQVAVELTAMANSIEHTAAAATCAPEQEGSADSADGSVLASSFGSFSTILQLLVGKSRNGVLPALQPILYPIPTLGQQLTLDVSIPTCQYDPLSAAMNLLPQLRCNMQLQVRKVTMAGAVQGMQNKALFAPPLAMQRYQQVADIITEVSAQRVLDFGCGSGRMMGHLAGLRLQGKLPSLTALYGCDISKGEIQAAKQHLAGIFTAHDTPKTTDLTWDVHLHDLLDPEQAVPGWAKRIDLLAVVEVIEHLDPKPLAAIAPHLIQRLQPKMVLITTPNSEYNLVLTHLGGGLLANNMRNSDHRFEWTRTEFLTWATEVANSTGYAVSSVFGVGQAVDELRAKQELAVDADIGFASQGVLLRKP